MRSLAVNAPKAGRSFMLHPIRIGIRNPVLMTMPYPQDDNRVIAAQIIKDHV
jgi:hypothetical protein